MFLDKDIIDLLDHYEKRGIQKVTDLNEFKEDVMRFSYIYRILKRYDDGSKLNVRLLLNHIIILHNIFGPYSYTVLLNRCDEEIIPYLSAAMFYMDILPDEYIKSVDQETLDEITIVCDNKG